MKSLASGRYLKKVVKVKTDSKESKEWRKKAWAMYDKQGTITLHNWEGNYRIKDEGNFMRSQDSSPFYFNIYFIYLAVLGLGCSTLHLYCSRLALELWLMGLRAPMMACGIPFPQLGTKPASRLHWKVNSQPAWPPGKSSWYHLGASHHLSDPH